MSQIDSAFEAAKKIISGADKSDLHGIAADILRVLVVYHGVCWRSELEEDLLKFFRFSGRIQAPKTKVDEALKILRESGLLTIEYHKRGEWRRKDEYIDHLLKLKDPPAARRCLEHDHLYLRYTSERQKIFDNLA